MFHLTRHRRQEIVGYLSGEGMSTRAIAPIVGVVEGTVRNDLRPAAQNYAPQPAPSGSTHITGEGVVIAESRRIDLVTGEVLIGELVEPDTVWLA